MASTSTTPLDHLSHSLAAHNFWETNFAIFLLLKIKKEIKIKGKKQKVVELGHQNFLRWNSVLHTNILTRVKPSKCVYGEEKSANLKGVAFWKIEARLTYLRKDDHLLLMPAFQYLASEILTTWPRPPSCRVFCELTAKVSGSEWTTRASDLDVKTVRALVKDPEISSTSASTGSHRPPVTNSLRTAFSCDTNSRPRTSSLVTAPWSENWSIEEKTKKLTSKSPPFLLSLVSWQSSFIVLYLLY